MDAVEVAARRDAAGDLAGSEKVGHSCNRFEHVREGGESGGLNVVEELVLYRAAEPIFDQSFHVGITQADAGVRYLVDRHRVSSVGEHLGFDRDDNGFAIDEHPIEVEDHELDVVARSHRYVHRSSVSYFWPRAECACG